MFTTKQMKKANIWSYYIQLELIEKAPRGSAAFKHEAVCSSFSHNRDSCGVQYFCHVLIPDLLKVITTQLTMKTSQTATSPWTAQKCRKMMLSKRWSMLCLFCFTQTPLPSTVSLQCWTTPHLVPNLFLPICLATLLSPVCSPLKQNKS